jgi:hypothetical protein
VIATVPLPVTKNGWTIAKTRYSCKRGMHDLYFTYTNNNLKKPTDNGATFDWFYFTKGFPGNGKQGYAEVKNQYWKLLSASVPTTPVMMDNPSDMHRLTNIFDRGNWLVKGDVVEPDVPESLNPFPKRRRATG